jgi:putative ABC transport system permease protein
LFAGLGLVNTAAMTTSERRNELATLRIIGGSGYQILRMIVAELVPTVAAALIAGGGIVALSLYGVPKGVSGVGLTVPVPAVAGILGGAALLGIAAGAVTGRLALARTTAASALRTRE